MATLELNKIYNEDCVEGLKRIPDESVDLVLTDPPFNINYFSNMSTSDQYKIRIQTAYKWDNDFDIVPVIKQFMRILKNDSYCLIFGCEENIKIMQENGCNQILIWDKQHNGMGDLSDFGIGYEFIFCFKKGNPTLKKGRINGVITSAHYGFFDKTIHPTQKPIKLMRYLLENCSNQGDIVLDGFVGSGTVPIACKQLDRNFIGFEIDKGYCDIANKRLQQENINRWF